VTAFVVSPFTTAKILLKKRIAITGYVILKIIAVNINNAGSTRMTGDLRYPSQYDSEI
jgi:hypothetical protein